MGVSRSRSASSRRSDSGGRRRSRERGRDRRRSATPKRSRRSSDRKDRSEKKERRRDRESRKRSRSRGRRSGGRERRERDAGSGEGSSALVRNLQENTSREDVRELFETMGDVRDVYIPKDYYTGRQKNFCFVEFWSARECAKAIRELDGESIRGSAISVIQAKHGRRSPGAMRQREKS